MSDPRRRIPAMDSLLVSDALADPIRRWGRARVARALAAVQDDLRGRPATGGGEVPVDPEWYADRVRTALDAEDRPRPGRVINATGVVLHTNLGRAPLAEGAVRAVAAAAGYSALEYELGSGARGSRQDHCADLLRTLTGADAALVVNNNAAAVLLALNTLSPGREAVISRGELVEIGGSFRVPEIMARSGAIMREVGSTNRTHARDYRDAVGERTRLILKVHRSNFRLEGFIADVGLGELAEIAAEADVPVVNDLGSGLLIDLEGLGLPAEPTARQALTAGADVVTMSGDKLMGGPQAGIILGPSVLVEAMRQNPLYRALRPDKLTLAGLHATLRLHLDEETALREVPVLRMLAAGREALAERAERLAARLAEHGLEAGTRDAQSAVGGGAYPGATLPAVVVSVAAHGGADAAAARLRAGSPPVVALVRDERIVLDPRTVAPAEQDELVDAVVAALRAGS